MKKICSIYHHFTCASKITIIWCTVPEIGSETDRIFCHFGPFLLFYPILHMCTINDSHMMYGSWDMEHDRHNFLSFWTIFCLFIPVLGFSLLGEMEGVPPPAKNLLISPASWKNPPSPHQIFIPSLSKVNSHPLNKNVQAITQ